jgi:hypothetical protein
MGYLATVLRQEPPAFPLPLLEFLERLGGHIHEAYLRGRVHGLVDELGREHGVVSEVEELRERLKAEHSARYPCALLLECEPRYEDPEKLTIRVWLIRQQADGSQDIRSLYQQDPADVDELRQLLDAQLPRLRGELGGRIRDLTIQFILPQQLLNTDVDRWMVPLSSEGEDPNPARATMLGAEYVVVVRDQRRFRHPASFADWKSKWASLNATTDVPSDQQIYWVYKDARIAGERPLYLTQEGLVRSDVEIYGELIDRYYDDEQPDRVCVVLLFAPYIPAEGSRTYDRDALDQTLAAGTPAVLWLRAHPQDPLAVRRQLEAMLRARRLNELPAVVKTARVRAAGDPGHWIGHQLTLLWDNAELTAELIESHRRLAQPDHG